jgi:hypothetical protein
MDAPVYRHLDTKPTFLGLTFPAEWLVVFLPIPVSLALKQFLAGALLTTTMYVTFRWVTYGQAEGHLHQLFLFRWRQRGGGRFSAAARTRQARYRFAPYAMDSRLRSLRAKASAELRSLAQAHHDA